ncbi:hypothetical protein CspHIS471_0301860 [Cutaneotrichosporon sp. HIS471]|nr:hypothetical protein CspHIS471_0301860 [Cutaneotrichosporon sp. HIS471]
MKLTIVTFIGLAASAIAVPHAPAEKFSNVAEARDNDENAEKRETIELEGRACVASSCRCSGKGYFCGDGSDMCWFNVRYYCNGNGVAFHHRHSYRSRRYCPRRPKCGSEKREDVRVTREINDKIEKREIVQIEEFTIITIIALVAGATATPTTDGITLENRENDNVFYIREPGNNLDNTEKRQVTEPGSGPTVNGPPCAPSNCICYHGQLGPFWGYKPPPRWVAILGCRDDIVYECLPNHKTCAYGPRALCGNCNTVMNCEKF